MKILSPAKINLFLQVTGKRPDGYHELFSLMCCVTLFDTIFLQFGTEKIEIESSHPQLPLDETNLAHKAAALFFKTLGAKEGVKITIEKSIPIAAGMGGGSSNAAGVLRGLSLGAEVPFLLFQKPALASGIGETLEAYPERLPNNVIIVHPGFRVSTAEVFQNLNLRLTKCKKKFTKPFLKKTSYNVSLHLCNDLEAVTVSKYPEIELVKEQLIKQGALGALMSGSGPTVFGLFSDRDKAGKAMQAIGRNPRWNAYLAEIIHEKYSIDR